MFGISRFSSSSGLGSDWLGEALLNLGFLRMGLQRGAPQRRRSADELPDHLRRDVGLPPRQGASPDPRDWR
jgi:hypothetical protein